MPDQPHGSSQVASPALSPSLHWTSSLALRQGTILFRAPARDPQLRLLPFLTIQIKPSPGCNISPRFSTDEINLIDFQISPPLVHCAADGINTLCIPCPIPVSKCSDANPGGPSKRLWTDFKRDWLQTPSFEQLCRTGRRPTPVKPLDGGRPTHLQPARAPVVHPTMLQSS